MGKEHLILIFHGSSNIDAKNSVEALKECIASRISSPFYICYLKESSPNLSDCLEEAYSNGAKYIKCIPMLMLPGNHMLKDIPSRINIFKEKHKDCTVEILPCLAQNKYFQDFLVQRLEADEN